MPVRQTPWVSLSSEVDDGEKAVWSMKAAVQHRLDVIYRKLTNRSWLIPTLTPIALTAIYIVLLIYFARPAHNRMMFSVMTKAESCYIDSIGHKSGGRKETTCCVEWLVDMCRWWNIMPCASLSVQYKLPDEEFTRAGYINDWDPGKLVFGYSNSHCMTVYKNCPPLEVQEEMESYPDLKLGQNLDCYVVRDVPERPIRVVAEMMPSSGHAFCVLVLPPLALIISLALCICTRNRQHKIKEKEEDESHVSLVQKQKHLEQRADGTLQSNGRY